MKEEKDYSKIAARVERALQSGRDIVLPRQIYGDHIVIHSGRMDECNKCKLVELGMYDQYMIILDERDAALQQLEDLQALYDQLKEKYERATKKDMTQIEVIENERS